MNLVNLAARKECCGLDIHVEINLHKNPFNKDWLLINMLRAGVHKCGCRLSLATRNLILETAGKGFSTLCLRRNTLCVCVCVCDQQHRELLSECCQTASFAGLRGVGWRRPVHMHTLTMPTTIFLQNNLTSQWDKRGYTVLWNTCWLIDWFSYRIFIPPFYPMGTQGSLHQLQNSKV